jgi:hypothetical protein
MPDEKFGSSQVVLYQTEDGKTRIETRFTGETAWLSLNQMAELFQRDKSVISKHVRNIFEEGELRAEATVANFATVQTEGEREVSRDIEFYNLDVIISVGYRVKSHQGTQFRIWATQRLREYIIKGFTEAEAVGGRQGQAKEGAGPEGDIAATKERHQSLALLLPQAALWFGPLPMLPDLNPPKG